VSEIRQITECETSQYAENEQQGIRYTYYISHDHLLLMGILIRHSQLHQLPLSGTPETQRLRLICTSCRLLERLSSRSAACGSSNLEEIGSCSHGYCGPLYVCLRSTTFRAGWLLWRRPFPP
jgi:hypothetical protein